MQQELKLREAWNRSMSLTLRQCSPSAQSFIRAMIERNRAIIALIREDQQRKVEP